MRPNIREDVEANAALAGKGRGRTVQLDLTLRTHQWDNTRGYADRKTLVLLAQLSADVPGK